MTDNTKILQVIQADIAEIKKDIKGLEAFERKALEHYVTKDDCDQRRTECTGAKRWNSSHLVAVISLAVAALALLSVWGVRV